MGASANEKTAAELALQRLGNEVSHARAVVAGVKERLARVHEDSVVPYVHAPDSPLGTVLAILVVIELIVFVTIFIIGIHSNSPLLWKALWTDVIAGAVTLLVSGIVDNAHKAAGARSWELRKAEADEQLRMKLRTELAAAEAEVERLERQIARNRAIVDA